MAFLTCKKRQLLATIPLALIASVLFWFYILKQDNGATQDALIESYAYWQKRFQKEIEDCEYGPTFPSSSFPLIKNPDPRMIPILVKFLESDNPGYRLIALKSLLSLGPKASPAAKNVLKCLEDQLFWNRYTAAKILASIQPYDNKQMVQALRNALKDENGYVRVEASYALWKATGNAKESLFVLKEIVLDNSTPDKSGWAEQAAFCLGMMGKDAKEAVPELVLILQKNDRTNQHLLVQSAMAIRNIGFATEEIKNVLTGFLMDPNESLREAASQSLSALWQGNNN